MSACTSMVQETDEIIPGWVLKLTAWVGVPDRRVEMQAVRRIQGLGIDPPHPQVVNLWKVHVCVNRSLTGKVQAPTIKRG